MEGYHKSVLLDEVLEYLAVESGKWYIDCTLGDGGHSLEILRLEGKVIGIDTDQEALERTRERFKKLGIEQKDFKLIKGNFRDLKNLIQSAFGRDEQTDTDQIEIAGILFDFGVSSLQLMSPERGFSFTQIGPLDMRMDKSLGVTAADLLNALNKGELYELFNKMGEERLARPLAEAVIRSREIKQFENTKQLADLVADIYRRFKVNPGKIHPATKVFQALRIAVNDELGVIQDALPQALEIVKEEGRVIAISFHSLEDRIVKQTFNDWEEKGLGKVLTDKVVTPTEEEIEKNPRSRSAKLRAFKKT